MKTERLKRKWGLMLNKKTISNLEYQEMVKVGAGAAFLNDDNFVDPKTDECGDPKQSPKPMDVGIPPDSQGNGESKTSYC